VKRPKFIPRARLVVELGDANDNGKADLVASLEAAGVKVSSPALDIDFEQGLALITSGFRAVKDRAERR
jgi:hypothetical protein